MCLSLTRGNILDDDLLKDLASQILSGSLDTKKIETPEIEEDLFTPQAIID